MKLSLGWWNGGLPDLDWVQSWMYCPLWLNCEAGNGVGLSGECTQTWLWGKEERQQTGYETKCVGLGRKLTCNTHPHLFGFFLFLFSVGDGEDSITQTVSVDLWGKEVHC